MEIKVTTLTLVSLILVSISINGHIEKEFFEREAQGYRPGLWPRTIHWIQVNSTWWRFNFKSSIKTALRHLEIVTNDCIKFVEGKPPSDSGLGYIAFYEIDEKSCSSRYVGYAGPVEHPIYLREYCDHIFRILHEVMHALGFSHEQNRLDRDKYIYINDDNVKPEYAHNYRKHEGVAPWKQFKYDEYSIMHYAIDIFAIDNWIPTMFPIRNDINIFAMGYRYAGVKEIFPMKELDLEPNEEGWHLTDDPNMTYHTSKIDREKLVMMYCNNITSRTPVKVIK